VKFEIDLNDILGDESDCKKIRNLAIRRILFTFLLGGNTVLLGKGMYLVAENKDFGWLIAFTIATAISFVIFLATTKPENTP